MTLTKDQVAKAFVLLQKYHPETVADYFGVTIKVLWIDLGEAEQLGFAAWR